MASKSPIWGCFPFKWPKWLINWGIWGYQLLTKWGDPLSTSFPAKATERETCDCIGCTWGDEVDKPSTAKKTSHASAVFVSIGVYKYLNHFPTPPKKLDQNSPNVGFGGGHIHRTYTPYTTRGYLLGISKGSLGRSKAHQTSRETRCSPDFFHSLAAEFVESRDVQNDKKNDILNRVHDMTNPKRCIFRGKSLKITYRFAVDLHGWIPPQMLNLMISCSNQPQAHHFVDCSNTCKQKG